MVGLDAAGKTTILYKLKLGEIVTTIPTIGESPIFPPDYFPFRWIIFTCSIYFTFFMSDVLLLQKIKKAK